MRRFGFSVFLLALTVLPSQALGAELLYDRWQTMEEDAKQQLVQRYVRKDREGLFMVSVSIYEVHCNVSAEYAFETAIKMDDFYNKFAQIFKGAFKLRGKPKLYVFDTLQAYQQWLATQRIGAGWSAGMYIPSKRMLVAQRSQGEEALKHILFHEGTHQLLHAYTGKADLAVWFNEGVATNFECWDLKYSPAENCRRSPIVSRRRRITAAAGKADKIYTLDQLTSLNHRTWNMARNPQMNYAMAWSFVNFLLSTTEGQQAFNEILRIVGGGGDLKKLLHPRLWKEIERLWHEDAKTRVALYDQLLAPYAEHPNLSDDQRGALLKKARQQYADLPDPWFYSAEAALKSGDHAAALKHLQEVEKRDDTWPDLDRLMGVCYFRTDEHMKATKHLRKALPITQNHEHKEEIREMMREIRQSRWQR